MPVKRTFGWAQNPGDLKKLKKVVGIFKPGSQENSDLINVKLPLLLTLLFPADTQVTRLVFPKSWACPPTQDG